MAIIGEKTEGITRHRSGYALEIEGKDQVGYVMEM